MSSTPKVTAAPALLLLALSACAETPPPADPAHAAPPGSAAAPPAGVAASPSARVIAVEVSRESAMYVRVKIAIQNPRTEPCRLVGYKLSWPGSAKEVHFDARTSTGMPAIPPGMTEERWLRVEPNDGDLGALTLAKSSVTIQTTCGLE